MNRKNAFIILRVEKRLKDRLITIAVNQGQNLSQFLRDVLAKINEKKS